jgi:hypothetical protein
LAFEAERRESGVAVNVHVSESPWYIVPGLVAPATRSSLDDHCCSG